jgi:hypothetical protein
MLGSVIVPGSLFYGIVFKIASIFPFYASYFEKILQESSGVSFGVLYQIILGFILLYYYIRMTPTKIELIVFNLSFIGAVLYNLFYGSPLLARFYIYFIFFQNYAFAFIVNYLVKLGRKLEVVGLMTMFLLVFFYKIFVKESGCCPYTFGIY